MSRFFAFRWKPADRRAEQACRALWAASGLEGWSQLIFRRGVLAFLATHEEDVQPVVLPDEQGVILGYLFDQSRNSCPVREFSSNQIEDLMRSEGRVLVERYWGVFTAVLHDRRTDNLFVVRDPVASRGIFVAKLAGVDADCIFTHAADFVAVAPDVSCDVSGILRYLMYARLVTDKTAIEGVREILPGQLAAFGRERFTQRTLWAPRRPAREVTSFDDAAVALRNAVGCVGRAWSEADTALAHRLSGGLDSSIVLWALSQSGAPPLCFHERPVGFVEGDERVFAAACASRFGAKLLEVEGDPAQVSYERIVNCALEVRPTDAGLSFASNRLVDAARSHNVRTIASGQGGDQVLHRSRKAWIAADAVRDGLGIQRCWKVALETARLCRCPIWFVLEAIASHGLARRQTNCLPSTAHLQAFLCEAAELQLSEEWSHHPWVAELERETPARAQRIAHVIDLQHYHRSSNLNTHFVSAPLLAMRPIVETCLAIPPYLMVHGGERGLARAAFATYVPDAILTRKRKGSTTRYHAAVLKRQWSFIRETLLQDSQLCASGVAKRPELEAALHASSVLDKVVSAGILSAFVAELWLKRFTQVRAAAQAKRAAYRGSEFKAQA